MRRLSVLVVITILAATTLQFGCFSSDSDDERGGVSGFLSKAFKKGGSGVPVVVQRVREREVTQKMTMPAILTSSDRVEVRLPNESRIERFFINVGESVRRGTPLFQISKEEFNIQLAQLRAEQKELQANVEKNTYFLRNRDRLLEEGRITTEQYDSLEGEVEKSESDLEEVNAKLTTLEAQTDQTTVDSPIAGVVQSKLESAGGVAAANTPIVTIVRNDPMIVSFRMAGYEANAVKPGISLEVRLTDIPGERFRAQITSIGAELDPDSNTFPVKATISNPQGILKAGMNAFVELEGSRVQRYYVVPTEAVITDRRRNYVFTVDKGVAHRVRVIPREIRGNIAEIVDGLSDGDMVVVKGQDKLSEGTVVDIWRR